MTRPSLGVSRLRREIPGILLFMGTADPVWAHAPDMGAMIGATLVLALPVAILIGSSLLAMMAAGWHRYHPTSAWAGLAGCVFLAVGAIAWVFAGAALLIVRGPILLPVAGVLIVTAAVLGLTFRAVLRTSEIGNQPQP